MHGSVVIANQDGWRPNAAWLALAAIILLYSFGSNLVELVLAYGLHDPRAMLVPNMVDRAFDDVARWLMLLVGGVIGWRAWGRRSTFCLGLGLAGLAAFPLSFLDLGDAFVEASLSLFNLNTGPVAYLLPAFAISLLDKSGIRVAAPFRWLFWVGLADAVAIWTYMGVMVPLGMPFWPQLLWGNVIFALIPYLLAMAVLFAGWVQAPKQAGQRLFLLFLAVSVIIAGNVLFVLSDNVSGIYPRAITNTSSIFRVVGSLLFAYAILKHRVIDLGFAVNRTLVYGAVAFTILVIFGLVEYLAKTMIPHAWPQAGSIVTACIAVLLFLSFHRLHHWFEHHIERFFFSAWHEAETALKRFVDSASHFETMEVLCRATVQAISQFADGSNAALYLRGSDGTYHLAAGQLDDAPEAYADDNPAFALMRAERKPLDLLQAPGLLPGELALPMSEQGALSGFVLLDGKADGTHYRPDQIETLHWAVHQIGLDLRVLHARLLETDVIDLRRKVVAISGERDRLLGRLAPQP